MSHKGHRSTLKQTNKPYKTKFATKGEAKRKTKGRVPGEERKGPKQQSKDGSKDRRKHQARQLREEKRHNLVQSRRNAAQGATPPKVVAFIDLSAAADSKYLISKLSTLPEIHRADETFATQTATDPKNVVLLDQSVNILSTTWKQRLALHATSNDTLALLDITKVADILVFVMSGEDNGEDLIDERARELIRLVSVQGFGLLYGVIQGGQTSHHSKLRKFLEHELLKQFGVESKIVLLPGPNSEESTIVDVAETIENEQDIATTKNFLRLLCQANPPPAPIDRHQKRPYVLAESIEFVPGASDQVGDLVVQGYVRGTPLSIHQLVHVPECDDFAIRSIVQAVDPCPVPGQARKVSTTTASSSSSSAEAEGDVAMGGADQTRKITPGTVLLTPSEKFQESLIQENIPDSLEGEQNISDDEMEAERLEIIRAAGRQKVLRRVPKGTTAYHASWIVDSDDDEDFDHDDDDDEEEDEDMMGLSSSKKPKKEGTEDEEDVSIKKMRSTIQYDGEEHDSDEEEEDEGDEVGEEEYELMDVDAEKERIRKEALMKRLAEMEQEDFDFPDEVETPFDESARERFAKYRGLKSFRTSPWDPKENLPRDYARIFQFQNFNHTQRRVLKKAVDPEAADVVPVGTFVSVVLADIPREIATFLAERHASAAHPVILFGLLQHERKISVLHATLKRSITYIDPIRSKEEMIMQIGFRRIRCCPVYSENSLKSNKFKLQKFFPHGDPSVASVYAPITYLPANVMMFRLDHSGKLDLVAEGSLHSVNPNRLIIKKIVLTGSIYKIYRRKCVVRGMFYDPVDIKWFKPVELRTRRGKTGHILEPVGTHGYMKCIFDNQLQHNDTVLMNLYKRAFPVWRSQYYSYNNLGPSLQLEDDLESKIIESDLRSTRSRRSTRSKRSTVSVRSSRSRRSAK